MIDTGTRSWSTSRSIRESMKDARSFWGRGSGTDFRCSTDFCPGDRVAASGEFLIDAESRINPRRREPSSAARSPQTASLILQPHRH